MNVSSRHLEAVVMGLLSVNSYPVEGARDILPGLRQEGLLDAHIVVAMETREVARRLVVAGYNRGGIADILAPRVQTLMVAVSNGELDRLPQVVERGDMDQFSAMLLRLPGVGPKVVETAWLILGAPLAK